MTGHGENVSVELVHRARCRVCDRAAYGMTSAAARAQLRTYCSCPEPAKCPHMRPEGRYCPHCMAVVPGRKAK